MKVLLLANPCAKNQQILLQWVICAFNKKAVSFCLKSHNYGRKQWRRHGKLEARNMEVLLVANTSDENQQIQ